MDLFNQEGDPLTSFERKGPTVKFKILNDLAKVPTRGTEGAAGWDLYAATSEEVTISPHQTVKIGTGIAMEIPHELHIPLPEYGNVERIIEQPYFGMVVARSGLATKKGLRPINSPGIIDSDYRGEIIVALHNDTQYNQTIEAGERIAQLIIVPYLNWDLERELELSETKRGDGGFGSTGAS